MSHLLDTNVLAEPLKSVPNPNVMTQMEAHRATLATCAIVTHEMRFGAERLPDSARKGALLDYLQEVISTLPVLPYDERAAAWHACERARLAARGLSPAFADGQIAAIAAVNGLILVTRNVADFQEFDGLGIENWFEDIGRSRS